MSWWDELSGTQKLAIGAGVPAVGLAVLVGRLRPQPEPPAEDDQTLSDGSPLHAAGYLAAYAPSTDAIGTGALSGFVTMLTDALGGISDRLDSLETGQPSPTPTTPTTPTTPVRAFKMTTATRTGDGDGETLAEVANRIRGPWLQTTTTPDGRPLTAAWLAAVNHLDVTTSRPLRIGTPIRY